MPETTPDLKDAPAAVMTPIEALYLVNQYVGGYIAWTSDRSGVYALAHSKDELTTKLAELGVKHQQASIDPIGQFETADDYGIQVERLSSSPQLDRHLLMHVVHRE